MKSVDDLLDENEDIKMTCIPQKIKHIVMSGGGICGFAFYGHLREKEKSGIWNISAIESIYGTSVGALFAVLIALKPHFEWEILDNFLINRPWDELFEFSLTRIISSIKNRGILSQSCIYEIYRPLFSAIDLSLDITMREFHEFTGKDLHIIVSKLENFTNSNCAFVLENISWKTHPDWKLIDAIYCSACLPILFQPYVREGDYYIDGGLLCNYPLDICIEDNNLAEDTDCILGLCAAASDEQESQIETLFDYLLCLLNSVWRKITVLNNKKSREPIKNEIRVKTPTVNIKDIYDTAKHAETRRKYINVGNSENEDEMQDTTL